MLLSAPRGALRCVRGVRSAQAGPSVTMSRQARTEAFARTTFLHGANATYIEEMQALYEQNPGAVNDEWRLFFQSLQEERGAVEADVQGPSWGRPLEELTQDGKSDLVAALTGDYTGAERQIRGKLE